MRNNRNNDSHRPGKGGGSRKPHGNERGERADKARGDSRKDRPKGDFRHKPKAAFRPDGEPWKLQQKKQPLLQATLWGTHAVQEAWLNPERRIRRLYLTELMFKSFEATLQKARALGLDRPEPQIMDKKDLDQRLPSGAVHQGIAIDADPLDEVFVQDIVTATDAQDRAVVLMLDQVTDPHNVGAILRSASAFGAAGVVMQRRHSPEMTGVLGKSACGAIDHLPVAYETNLSRALEVLQKAGFFAIAMDEHAETSLAALPGKARTVLLLGAEGTGLRQKLREQCDALVRLPTQGAIQSLNVSNAAAIALYDLATKR
jgi:23S rRNA (guanosine2251-2'-O)-methyltransferase